MTILYNIWSAEQEGKGVVVVVGGPSQSDLNHRDASQHNLSQPSLSQHGLQTSLLDEVVHFRSSIYPPRGPGTGTTSSTSTTSTTTTIPVSDFTSPLPPRAVERDEVAAPSPSQQKRKTSTTPRKSASKGSGDTKRTTHEKSKSVTIVVNDQHVTYSNTASTYTTTAAGGHRHNGSLTNGDLGGLHAPNGEVVAVNGHALTKGDLGGDSRPSSAASTAGGTKVDPDIQVSRGHARGSSCNVCAFQIIIIIVLSKKRGFRIGKFPLNFASGWLCCLLLAHRYFGVDPVHYGNEICSQ